MRDRFRLSRPVVFLLLLLAGHGCRPDAPAREALVTVRDSAGVRIVESAAPAWPDGHGWSVGAAPVVEIGAGVTEGEMLFRVNGALRLENGTIVVANAGSQELKYFGPDGALLTVAGGEGEGPGEFMGGPVEPWRVAPDTVAAWDFRQMRASYFDARGGFVRSVTVRPPSGIFPMGIGELSDGRVVGAHVSNGGWDGPFGSRFRPPRTYHAFTPDGAHDREIVTVPGSERIVTEWTGRRMMGPGPLSPATSAALRHGVLYLSTGDTPEIRRYDVAGESMAIFRLLIEPPPVTARDIADLKAERMANAPSDPEGREAWESWLDDVPYPETGRVRPGGPLARHGGPAPRVHPVRRGRRLRARAVAGRGRGGVYPAVSAPPGGTLTGIW